MFKKIPYGLKVRVRGNDTDGYIAEYARDCNRFLPFLDVWGSLNSYDYDTGKVDRFHTLEAAQQVANERYDRSYARLKEAADYDAEEAAKKKANAAQRRKENSFQTVWRRP